MAPRSPRRLALQLPPELDDSSPTDSAKSSVQSLLPRALDKLSKLGPVENLKLRNVVGRGERSEYVVPGPLAQGLEYNFGD